MLWDRSKSISPPHHINFLSVPGFVSTHRTLRPQLVDVMTPGRLDVDIVRNMALEDPELELPRFVRSMFKLTENLKYHPSAHVEYSCLDSSLSSHTRPMLEKHRLPCAHVIDGIIVRDRRRTPGGTFFLAMHYPRGLIDAAARHGDDLKSGPSPLRRLRCWRKGPSLLREFVPSFYAGPTQQG